jgi:hypothetical protein
MGEWRGARTMKRPALSLMAMFLLVLSAIAQKRSAPAESNRTIPCDKYMKFCWYSDEVDAWGTLWRSDDSTEKSLEQVTEVRCVKRLHVCIKARNQKVGAGFLSATNIDLYNVREWNETEVRAVMDEQIDPECETDTLVVNRVEQSVLTISSPGPGGSEKRCTNMMGQPKTVVYRLTNPELDSLEPEKKAKHQ